MKQPQPRAVVVGGSIAGVSCAHTLALAGWDVVVLEKLRGPPTGSSTGVGVGLPEEIGSLEALEELFLSNCSPDFTTLPDSIGNLKSLVVLDIYYVRIVTLPDTIGKLKKLKHLLLRSCWIERLPETLGDIQTLVQLDLQFTYTAQLPDSIGRLKKLQYLCLSLCRWLETLPSSIGYLEELIILEMSYCKVKTLPRSIGMMQNLEELLAFGSYLEEIPPEIGRLSCLRTLDLSWTNICQLPSTIDQLSSLENFSVQLCERLKELPKLPAGLVHLSADPGVLESVILDLLNKTSLVSINGQGVEEWRLSQVKKRKDQLLAAVHWADIHGLLYNSTPQQVLFLWGHLFHSFSVSNNKKSVKVKAKVLQSGETIEVDGDLLVAADGCLSSGSQSFLPDLKLRYSGYCAWRGVFDYSGIEDSENMKWIRAVYPGLGKCLCFDLAPGTHNAFPNKRINWLWYINQPEPELKEPFMNVKYDADPLDEIFRDNVVLVGNAAHPTTPHCAWSTNMSILDAEVLGRVPQEVSWEPAVLKSRRVEMIKQGLKVAGCDELFDPSRASLEEREELEPKTMPFTSDVPLRGTEALSSL
ncbi:hypothetical protein CRG98_036061 [Punica granatum]|uniref:Disease resistance R13L4/SHOC-2-like LRR domain-containing protein n=1 Tax=Punica granatum TaxID=22663 RepID=A0A2I0IHT8_PUNGR|nr:hypothetical protein CRG98_036061 [Punica granatum]